MVAASVTARIFVGRGDIELDHAVQPEVAHPNVHTQFDGEVREKRPGEETRDCGHSFVVTEMHIVEGCVTGHPSSPRPYLLRRRPSQKPNWKSTTTENKNHWQGLKSSIEGTGNHNHFWFFPPSRVVFARNQQPAVIRYVHRYLPTHGFGPMIQVCNSKYPRQNSALSRGWLRPGVRPLETGWMSQG